MMTNESPDSALGGALRALLKHPGVDEVEIVVRPKYPKGTARPIVLLDFTVAALQEVARSLPYPKPLQGEKYWSAVSLDGQVVAKFPATDDGKAEGERYVADSPVAVRVALVRTIEGGPSLGEIWTEALTGIRATGPTTGGGVP